MEKLSRILHDLDQGNINVELAKQQVLDLFAVSGLLAYQKAVEFAKFKHQDEYYDKAYARDVEDTIYDFKSGFATAMKIANDR
jgi:hypothetical protein